MRRLIKYIILFALLFCQGTILVEGKTTGILLPRDSSYVMRSPDADFLEKYRKDAHFDYDGNMTTAPGLWDWIKRWILCDCFVSNGLISLHK